MFDILFRDSKIVPIQRNNNIRNKPALNFVIGINGYTFPGFSRNDIVFILKKSIAEDIETTFIILDKIKTFLRNLKRYSLIGSQIRKTTFKHTGRESFG